MDDGRGWIHSLTGGTAASIGWYDSNFAALGVLVETLVDRRTMIRSLIEVFRMSVSSLFPKWMEN
jgi:hypothetical protein